LRIESVHVAAYGAELAAVICFVLAFRRLDLSRVARGALQSALEASRVLRSSESNDEEKERAARSASLALFRSLGSITVRSVAALAVSFVPLAVFHVAGLARISEVNRLMLSTNGIVLGVVVAALVYVSTKVRT
jgi:hypothetical protein